MMENIAQYLWRYEHIFKAKFAGFQFPEPCSGVRNEVM